MSNNDLTDSLFQDISRFVFKHCGINLTENKRELVNTRLSKVIRNHDFSGFKEYFIYLKRDKTGEAISELMNAISTNLTSFYREPTHFTFMQQKMLPEIIKKASQTGDYKLRGWSAGCSMGAEAYTLGITLHENIPGIERWDAKLLATDIDTNMLTFGKKGVYNKKQIDNIPKNILKKYFQRSISHEQYKAKTMLRNFIQFKYLNLINDFPFKQQFDFIFCRNVMIYFTKDTQQLLINKFYKYLKNNGYLFIGHSEGLSGLKHNYKYIQPTIYQKS